jgi:hypothetical protein
MTELMLSIYSTIDQSHLHHEESHNI